MTKAFLCFMPLGLLTSCSPVETQISPEQVAAKSLPLANKFQQQLQEQLGAAMKAGGPAKAIEVCHEAAPAIASALAAESGATIRRVSLRNRNPANVPDTEESKVLDQLASAPLDMTGKPATHLWQTESTVHFMRAIPMKEQPCAACHGTKVAPEIEEKIFALYPRDKATGYKPGDLRGAISITWPRAAFESN